ncbi:hypothetical protein HID58_044075 [Brassica napus]|uniref:MORF/ORRM1/DAG-like MORF domain-containing protein n=4 Tax=Brassica TaxID=3705 RepID=A0ABQ8BIB4_BRANA|nr:hypothetical protein HID58_044075 [Brassica napus]CDY32326.1 BnaC01g36450D [Brassica napus]VDD52518.1 unnamed protein product [Brassica oleracea]
MPSTEKLKTHKPDLQQIPYNLTGEEGKEEQEKDVSLFPVMVRSTAHQKASFHGVAFHSEALDTILPLSRTPAAPSLLSRSRPLAAALSSVLRGGFVSVKGLSSQATASSLKDPSPNWSNRPPKETILLDGCDFEHWLVVVDPPQGDLTRDEIIDGYIKTLAQIVGSEEEARMKIYSVSHRCYFAFGALVSEDLSHKLKELPNVRWVLPDSYLDVRNKGSPPQRPPMGGPPPPQNYGGPPPPPNNMGGQMPPPNYGGPPPQNYMGGQRPPTNYGGAPPQTNMGGAPQPNYGGAPPQTNMGGAPRQNNMGGGPPPNAGWSGNNNNYQQQSGGMQQPQYQNSYPPNRDGSGNPYQG